MLGAVGCHSLAPRDQLQMFCRCLGQEHWQGGFESMAEGTASYGAPALPSEPLVATTTICQDLWPSSTLSCQSRPSISPVSMKWRKWHSNIRFELADGLDWRRICTNWIWLHFKPPHHVVWTWFAKIRISCGFSCPDFLKSIWIQPGYTKNQIWDGSLNKALVYLNPF